MKLRNGKQIICVKSVRNKRKQSISIKKITNESSLRNGKSFRNLIFTPLPVIDMIEIYNSYLNMNKQMQVPNKIISETILNQFKTFKSNLTTLILKKNKNQVPVSFIKLNSCLVLIKENLNLLFCPALLQDSRKVSYLKKIVFWMHNQLKSSNDKTILNKYSIHSLHGFNKEFKTIYSCWLSLLE